MEPHPNDRLGPASSSWGRRLAAAGVAAAIALPALRKLTDPDLPWHLAVGRAAVAARGPIPADDFSYTFPGFAVPYEYASDVGLYLAHRSLGFWGLHLLAAAAIAALAWLMILRPGKTARPAAWAAAGLALAALAPFLILRPALLGLPLFAAVLLCIDRHRAGGSARWLWLIAPLQVLWANVHAFAVLGPVVAFAYAAHAGLCRLSPSRWESLLPAREGRHWRTAALAALAAAAAACLSSFGPAIFMAPLRVREHGRFLAEWAPASWDLFFRYDPALGLVLALVLAALVWGREEKNTRTPPLFDLALLAGAALLMLARFRLAPCFIIAAAPWTARRLWPVMRQRRWLPAALAAAGLWTVLAVAARREAPLGIGFDPARLPEAAANFIAEKKPQGPVFNDLAFGGWLIWSSHPDLRVFIDGRTAWLYPQGFLAEAWAAQYQDEAFSRLASRYGFQWAVVGAWPEAGLGRPLAASRDWAMVFLDDTAAVYVDVNGPNRDLARSGYQLLRHLSPWPMILQLPLPLDALEHDCKLALAQAPDSLRAHLWAAAAALKRGDLAAAARHRDRAAALAPRGPDLQALDRFLAEATSSRPGEPERP